MAETKELPGRIVPVGFANESLQPPSDLYVTANDALVITSYNSATGLRVDVRGILLRTDGVAVPFEVRHVPNSDRSAKTTVFPLTEGFLLSASVFLGSGSAQRGQCYVQVSVARGIEASQVLHRIITQGYVGTSVNLAWPGNRLEQPTEGAGLLRSIVGTDPAAGVEISETVPTGARWRIQTFHFLFTTSGVAANRQTALTFSDGVNTFAQIAEAAFHTASQAIRYTFGAAMAAIVAASATIKILPLPVASFLKAGYIVSTSTTALDAGDNYAAPVYTVEEWIEP